MRKTTAALLMLILLPAAALAQPAGSPPHKGHPVAWTIAGAGGGFALGMFVGLKAFDDDVDSDRKVWTTAVVSAAAGGAIAYLLSRRHTPARRAGASPLTDAELHELAARFSAANKARPNVAPRTCTR